MMAKFSLIGLFSPFLFSCRPSTFVLTLPKHSLIRPATDGIIVITGGQQRLADGLHLLAVMVRRCLYLVLGEG